MENKIRITYSKKFEPGLQLQAFYFSKSWGYFEATIGGKGCSLNYFLGQEDKEIIETVFVQGPR